MFIILAFVASVVFGLVLMPVIMKFCMKRNLYDLPNGRKVHQNAVPRLGGLAFIPCMLLAFVIAMVVLGNVTGHYSQITIGLWSGTFLVSLFTIYIDFAASKGIEDVTVYAIGVQGVSNCCNTTNNGGTTSPSKPTTSTTTTTNTTVKP